MTQNKANIKYWSEEANLKWQERQFNQPNRRTVAFEKFLSQNVDMDNQEILDIACGGGGVTSYIAQLHRSSHFTGIDINVELFRLYQNQDDNVRLEYGDIYNLNDEYINKYNGIICFQTLSWLPEYKRPLEQMCKLNAEWMAFSSLFYDGKINYTISLENYERPTHNSKYSQVYYNIYSVPMIAELLAEYGYTKVHYYPYEIDIDLNKPEHKDLGFYTVKTDEGVRLGFNTCLYQPEGFIFASR